MKRLIVVLAVVMSVSFTALTFAADSPQFRGQKGDGKFSDTGLLKKWPDGGPEKLWAISGIGKGYASVSVVGDTIYTAGMLDDKQGYVFALDLNGNIKKKVTYGKETQDNWAPGARSTPTIDGNRLYVMSGLGVLNCFDAGSLKKIWSVDTIAVFGAKIVKWSIAESVLIDGNNVICTPGGKDASVVALDKMTGKTVWTSKGLSDVHAYCSPNIIERGGNRLLITMTAKYVVGLDPANGKLLWKHEFTTKYDIHAVTPVYADGMLYYTGGYKSGGGMLKLSADGTSVTPGWKEPKLDCQHDGVVLVDGYIYGTNQSGKELMCLELTSGKVMWKTKDVRKGAVVFADGMLYHYADSGSVNLIKPDPRSFQPMGTVKIPEGEDKHWTHPTIANGKLYIRHGTALVAFNISAK